MNFWGETVRCRGVVQGVAGADLCGKNRELHYEYVGLEVPSALLGVGPYWLGRGGSHQNQSCPREAELSRALGTPRLRAGRRAQQYTWGGGCSGRERC